MNDSVFVAVPHYGAIEPDALPGLVFPSEERRLKLVTNGASLLACNFNRLWCEALNERQERGLTHFAMHHADVAAPPLWLDVLIDELDAHRADVVSAVVPIKDPRGLTSTGWQDPETLRITRFTMREIMQLPETFDAEAAGKPGQFLMVNTGLWVCRFDTPWAEEVCFEIRDAVVKFDDGSYRANVLPEDWNFSGWCARKGLKVMATRKVRVVHHGRSGFANDHAWGTFEFDEGD